jgi:DNA topoisomerase-1
MDGYTLVIAEKPSSAQKIATALADGKVDRKASGKVAYYEISRGGENIVVVPAVGHLYGLSAEKPGYPVFDVAWKPSYEVSKTAGFTKPYLQLIQSLAKKAKHFIIAATDFDIEGEVIAANLLDFACHAKESHRMKFSTLTKEDLVKAYEQQLPSLDKGMVSAGRTRHALDFYWGVSLSRALMHAIKTAGMFKVMSIGRVQGPALSLLSKREKEILAFVPTPYWVVLAKIDGVQFEHEKNPFKEEPLAKDALAKAGKSGTIVGVKKSEYKQAPPTPFDLTTLQTEAHKCFDFSPARTLEIAQKLYESAIISYPRTSSQKLPAQLDLPKIISKLGNQPAYSKLAGELLEKKRFEPNEGKNSDPAHPAVYPTGEMPMRLLGPEAQLYDLIAKRFLATFAEASVREKLAVDAKLGTEVFKAEGVRTIVKNWLEFYEPYSKQQETVLPAFSVGQAVTATETKMDERKTKPPDRFSEASLVRKLEEEDLGTKATRSAVIQTLFDRGYIKGKSIEVTAFGMSVNNSLFKYSPQVLSEQLTRDFEKDMEQIQAGEKKSEEVLEKGRGTITQILDEFKDKELAVGKELLSSFNTTQRVYNTLGKCNSCAEGNLVMRKGKFGQFVGCSAYPNCRNTFPLPGDAVVKAANKICDKCKTPIVWVRRKGKRPWSMCLSPVCETKKDWGKPKEGTGSTKPPEAQPDESASEQ